MAESEVRNGETLAAIFAPVRTAEPPKPRREPAKEPVEPQEAPDPDADPDDDPDEDGDDRN